MNRLSRYFGILLLVLAVLTLNVAPALADAVATKVVFTTTAQTIGVGTASSVMTIQTQDSSSNPVNVVSNTTVNLATTSGTGAFSLSNSTWANITSVTIPSGSNSINFYYKDTAAGTPTITAASTGLTSATQQETVILPDMQPTQILVNTLYAAATNTVTVVVANNNNAAANNFAVELDVNGVKLSTQTSNSISAHNDPYYWPLSVNFNWKPASAGSYTLKAIVNPDGSVQESNTSNDQLQQTVTVVNLAPVTVTVRVEGKSSTIWSGQVTFTTSTITDKQGTTTTIDHPTALGALNAAAKTGAGFAYDVSSAYGLLSFVDSVGNDANQGADGWLYLVNWLSPSVAAVNYTLANGDTVLWYYGGYSAEPLQLSVDKTSLLPSDNFTVTVQAFNGTNWSAIQGASVQAASHIYTTDINGKVLNISLPPGGYTISATIGTVDTYIRSNTVNVVVNAPLNLQPGWNFISIPKRLVSSDSTTLELLGSINTAGHSIFNYSPSSGWVAMGPIDTVSPLDGIWIYSATAAVVQPVFDPNPQQVPPTKQLSAGWNAVGFTDFNASPANVALSSVASGWSTVIGFNATTQAYDTSIINNAPASDPHSGTTPMSPWKGYWLYMTSTGQLAAISS